MHIAVVNFSGIPDADVARWVAAIATQLQEWAELWEAVPPSLGFYPAGTLPPADSSPMAIFQDADQSGFLGWHSESPDGKPYGKVFVSAIGDALPVSVVLSHEILEAAADPSVNRWADSGGELSYAWEVCDPVEGDHYEVNGVEVSNFVTPAWFDPQADRGLKFDRMGHLVAPFELARGGYVVRRNLANGQTTSLFGAQTPEFRKNAANHPMTRSTRRGVVLCLDES